MKYLVLGAALLAATPASAETVAYFVKVDSCDYRSAVSGAASCGKEIQLVADTYSREVFLNIQLGGNPLPVQVQFALDAQPYETKTVRNTVGFLAKLRGRAGIVRHAEKDDNGYRWSAATGDCAGNGSGDIECKAASRDDLFVLKIKGVNVK